MSEQTTVELVGELLDQVIFWKECDTYPTDWKACLIEKLGEILVVAKREAAEAEDQQATLFRATSLLAQAANRLRRVAKACDIMVDEVEEDEL